MKNLKLLPILLFISIFSFSCSDSDSDSNSDPSPSVSLIGKWEVLIMRLTDGGYTETYLFSNELFMEFKSDGKVILSFTGNESDPEPYGEIWMYKKISNTQLLLDFEGDGIRYQEFSIKVKNKNELMISQTSGYREEWFEFEIKRK